MLRIEAATPEQVRQVGGSLPHSLFGAVAVMEGDTLLGVGGYYLGNGALIVASKMTPAARAGLTCRAYQRALLKAAYAVMGQIIPKGIPIDAYPEEGVPAAEQFLKHLGFQPKGHGRYRWAG